MIHMIDISKRHTTVALLVYALLSYSSAGPLCQATCNYTKGRRSQGSASNASNLTLDARVVIHLPCFFTLSYSEPPRACTADTSSS